jgi:hypothetical protein
MSGMAVSGKKVKEVLGGKGKEPDTKKSGHSALADWIGKRDTDKKK